MTAAHVVTYRVDDETTVDIEIEPVAGYVPAGVGDIAGRVRDAAGPAVKAAQVVLEEVKQLSPDDVRVRFGVRASGTTNWLLARASAEATFEITLTWRPRDGG